MSAKHFFRHLVLAYSHFHPIDEHRQFAERMARYEKQRLKGELTTQIASVEMRFNLAMNQHPSEELEQLKGRIKALKQRIER